MRRKSENTAGFQYVRDVTPPIRTAGEYQPNDTTYNTKLGSEKREYRNDTCRDKREEDRELDRGLGGHDIHIRR